MASANLGKPLTGAISVPGGEARLFERGATIPSDAGHEVAVDFRFPPIGIPRIATGDAANALVLEHERITFETALPVVEALRALFAERLALLPTGKDAEPVPLLLGTPRLEGDRYGVEATAALSERQLYDIAIKDDEAVWQVVAPHAIYYRSSWHDCGIAHITDTHVARRIDYFADRLELAGMHEYADSFVNFNNRFRGFIRYANYLHDQGLLDVILATGDLIDYQYENEDDIASGGNAWFVRQILLGLSSTARFPNVEELRVPMFIVPGNHDYRKWPYYLVAILDLGIKEKNIPNFETFRLNWPAAIVAQGGAAGGQTPRREKEDMQKGVEVARDMASYKAHLTDEMNYVVELGPHRIVMLDTGPDVGIADSMDVFLDWLGAAPEDTGTFLEGSPNSEGVSQECLDLVVDTLNNTPDEGLFIVGLHAPLINADRNEYPYFLRETQRVTQPDQAYGWLARRDLPWPAPPDGSIPKDSIRGAHPLWFGVNGDPDAVNYVKRGSPDDLLDWAVSRSGLLSGPQEVGLSVHVPDDSSVPYGLMKALAGIGSRRKADLVLQGHVHRDVEFRLTEIAGDVACSMDFYTRDVHHYYPTRFTTGWRVQQMVIYPDTDVTYVDVVRGSPARNEPTPTVTETRYHQSVMVPPYASPLSSATDPRSWWDQHRPLVLLTGALGPFNNAEADLNGFRLLTVRNDVIERLDRVSIETLHAADYQLEWEQAREPKSRRFHFHLCRSREFDAPQAAGSPCGLMPSPSTENIFYRDTQGRIIEIWRDTTDQRGTGNLTAAASATPAAGDPSCYLDTGTGTVILPYRGVDGAVHSVYSIPGGTGHDALSGSIGAPNADSEPFGFHNPGTGIHHVIYRSGGHLQVLYWSGNSQAGHEELTVGAGAIEAQGNPAGYVVTTRGTHVVVYRGADNHIRSIYWTQGPAGMDDLSGFTQSPPAAGDPAATYIQSRDT